MGICSDDATTYLNRLGYNVVRHPQGAIKPLHLIGRQGGTTNYLGSIEQILVKPAAQLPPIEPDIDATDINGQNTSSLKLGVGANILGSVVGAMGGNLGVNTSYTNAKTVQFQFTGVKKDRTAPLSVSDYLRNAEIDAASPLVAQYVLGNGNLYVITEIVRSKVLVVTYQSETGVAASVDVPAVQNLVGANVSAQADSAATGKVTYSGPAFLTFGFRCFEVGVKAGVVTLFAVKPGGATALAVGDVSTDQGLIAASSLLTQPNGGLLDLQ